MKTISSVLYPQIKISINLGRIENLAKFVLMNFNDSTESESHDLWGDLSSTCCEIQAILTCCSRHAMMWPWHPEWCPSQTSADLGFSQMLPLSPSAPGQSPGPSVPQSEASPSSLHLPAGQSESEPHRLLSSPCISGWMRRSVQKCCSCPGPSQLGKTCGVVWPSVKW